MHKVYFYFSLLLIFYSCESYTPKPKGALRLDYPYPKYHKFDNADCSFSFQINEISRVVSASGCDLNIEYPNMNATIYLSYKPIEKNLKNLIKDAQKLTYEHTIKADQIIAQNFINNSAKVYGTVYEVIGNAASQVQFYTTDSTKHFLAGSVYFKAKPNYDSILPAAHYLKKDIQKIVESLNWKP